jgi:hypothetical protein
MALIKSKVSVWQAIAVEGSQIEGFFTELRAMATSWRCRASKSAGRGRSFDAESCPEPLDCRLQFLERTRVVDHVAGAAPLLFYRQLGRLPPREFVLGPAPSGGAGDPLVAGRVDKGDGRADGRPPGLDQ